MNLSHPMLGICRLTLIAAFLSLACAAKLQRSALLDTTAVRQLPSLTAAGVRYRPALIEGKIYTVELRWKAAAIRIFPADSLHTLADSLGIAPPVLPFLTVWFADPTERPTQRLIDYQKIEPPNFYTNEDRYHGNRIRHWGLSSRLADGQTIEVIRRFRYRAYTLETDLLPENVGLYENNSFYQFYTQEEPGLEQTDELRAIALEISQTTENPLEKATAIADWLRRQEEVMPTPTESDTAVSEADLQSDGRHYSTLFVALCRTCGIPARVISGIHIADGRRLTEHAWAECFLPNYGWVPADVGAEDFVFGRLDYRHLTTAVGTNIPLVDLPGWAEWVADGIDRGHAVFMPLAIVVAAGFSADFSAELVLVNEDDF